MAGDVGIHEEVVVHTGVARLAAASADAVTAIGGGVTHQYGPRVVIAAVPPHAVPSVRAAVSDGEIAPEAGAISEDVLSGLDDVGAMGLAAFALRQSPEYPEAKAERPRAGEDWDADDVEPPDVHDGEAESFALEAGAPTSLRLTGKVAVGIVIVEGPTNALKFSAAERTKVVAEVQNGLSWLGSQSSPAGISWSYDIKVVTLTTQPNNADTTLAQKEARWRDPALQKLGFATGMAGVQAYVNKLRTSLATDWAYCAFFVKYPVGHFAYASLGGPRMVMQYANDGWGPDNIDRVFAHESGHIFGAPDEYAASELQLRRPVRAVQRPEHQLRRAALPPAAWRASCAPTSGRCARTRRTTSGSRRGCATPACSCPEPTPTGSGSTPTGRASTPSGRSGAGRACA